MKISSEQAFDVVIIKKNNIQLKQMIVNEDDDVNVMVDCNCDRQELVFHGKKLSDLLYQKKSITISVPSTSANLGNGFDTLGIAFKSPRLTLTLLEIYENNPDQLIILNKDDEQMDEDLVYQISRKYTQHGFHVKSNSEIPMGRGLGSSAAAIVAALSLLYCVNSICRAETITIQFNEFLSKVHPFESHFDNVGPCLTGGLVSALSSSRSASKPPLFRLNVFRISEKFLTSIQPVVFIPKNTRTATKEARSLVTHTMSLQDHIETMQKAISLVNMMTGSWEEEKFRPLFRKTLWEERIHTRARANLIQQDGWICLQNMNKEFMHCLESQYYGIAISGSGPSILAFFSPDHHKSEIERIVTETFSQTQFDILDLKFANDGLAVHN